MAGDDEDYSGQGERRENINDPYSLTGSMFPSYASALKMCLTVIENDTFDVTDIIDLFVRHRIKIGGMFVTLMSHASCCRELVIM
jgi:hypothetical protein